MSERRRIGVFGGTFDPIHRAHIDIARAARAAEDLDLVLFVVAAVPPHKREETYASPEQRFRMVEAAVAAEEGMEASDIELKREGPSYTCDTLETLSDRYPDCDLSLILGIDSFLDLRGWKRPEVIASLARLLVVWRPGEGTDIPSELVATYTKIPFEETEVSSTEIRRRIAEGASMDDVPSAVMTIIQEEGLYNVNVSDRASR